MSTSKPKASANEVKQSEKEAPEDDFQEISLFKNPIQTVYHLIGVIIAEIKLVFSFLRRNLYIPILILAYIALVVVKEGPHRQFIDEFNKIGYFGLYWILLGVASSIGLGTGLHTFVLYLGPHIAKVTLAANECSYFPEMFPNKWEFQDFLPCKTPATDTNSTSFWTIVANVQLEAFLWGLGTAIGELPPYYMARAARLAGKSNEEVSQLEEIGSHYNEMPFIEKAKYVVWSRLKTHGFIIVMLAASIPNPLFDLAGITCGHFLVPFKTFFGATFIGKALVKVTLQSAFVIFTFSKHHVEFILNFLESNLPFLHGSLSKTLEKQKNLLWHSDKKEDNSDKPLIATIWEVVITVMIVYFLISIINSVVSSKRRKEHDERNKKQE